VSANLRRRGAWPSVATHCCPVATKATDEWHVVAAAHMNQDNKQQGHHADTIPNTFTQRGAPG